MLVGPTGPGSGWSCSGLAMAGRGADLRSAGAAKVPAATPRRRGPISEVSVIAIPVGRVLHHHLSFRSGAFPTQSMPTHCRLVSSVADGTIDNRSVPVPFRACERFACCDALTLELTAARTSNLTLDYRCKRRRNRQRLAPDFSWTPRRKAVSQNIFRPTVLFETGYRSHD